MDVMTSIDSFGGLLREHREAAGLTREQLAERAGLTANGIAALERGRRLHPHPHTVRALADALDLSEGQRTELAGAVAKRAPTVPVREAARSPLPLPPTPLVGRAREIEEVEGILRTGNVTLLTLTGPGGVGKTRLALEVARSLIGCFDDGAAFVPLASVGDPGLVIPTVARSFGLTEAGGQPLQQTLRTFLHGKRMLLVLDNLEQVLHAATEVAELLSTCPGIAVLATSRAPLRVRGEREYPVRPLETPGPDRKPNIHDLASNPAVALFVERARAASAGFRLTETNAAAVAAICRRLDGLPLALELAAARMRAMSPTELLGRLDRSLPMLSGGARDLPERQRTLRRAIEWSYQLLEEPQWRLLNRMSVFRGGWDLEAAEAVGDGGDITEEEVLDLLTSLVEQSLVVAEALGSTTRYRMLVPVMEYAEERLVQSGEADVTRLRHAGYFRGLAKTAEPEMTGPRQVEWLGRLDTEQGNLRTAVQALLERGQVEAAVDLLWSLWMYWRLSGQQRDARRWSEEALAEWEGALSPIARARALLLAGIAMFDGGDPAARASLEEASRIFRGAGGGDIGLAIALHFLGRLAASEGDHTRSRTYFEKSLYLYHAEGEEWGVAMDLINLGLLALTRGEHTEAVRLLEEGLATARSSGDRVPIHQALYSVGLLAHDRGEEQAAAEHFTEGLGIAGELRDRLNAGYFIKSLAGLAAGRGRNSEAVVLLGAAEAMLEAAVAPRFRYPLERSLQEQAEAAARVTLGDQAYAAAWAEGRSLSGEDAIAEALEVGRQLSHG